MRDFLTAFIRSILRADNSGRGLTPNAVSVHKSEGHTKDPLLVRNGRGEFCAIGRRMTRFEGQCSKVQHDRRIASEFSACAFGVGDVVVEILPFGHRAQHAKMIVLHRIHFLREAENSIFCKGNRKELRECKAGGFQRSVDFSERNADPDPVHVACAVVQHELVSAAPVEEDSGCELSRAVSYAVELSDIPDSSFRQSRADSSVSNSAQPRPILTS